MNAIQIGNYIKEKRFEQDLSAKELAERIGVSREELKRWEAGEKFPASESLPELSAALKVSTWSLLNGEDRPKSDRILIQLMRMTEVLRMLWVAIAGLLIMNAAVYIQPVIVKLLLLGGVSGRSFWMGLCDGTFTGFKMIGVIIFAYGIACYGQNAVSGLRRRLL